jgi:hypothetical protein
MAQKHEFMKNTFANDFFFNYQIDQIMSTFLHLSKKLPPWGKNILSNCNTQANQMHPNF